MQISLGELDDKNKSIPLHALNVFAIPTENHVSLARNTRKWQNLLHSARCVEWCTDKSIKPGMAVDWHGFRVMMAEIWVDEKLPYSVEIIRQKCRLSEKMLGYGTLNNSQNVFDARLEKREIKHASCRRRLVVVFIIVERRFCIASFELSKYAFSSNVLNNIAQHFSGKDVFIAPFSETGTGS